MADSANQPISAKKGGMALKRTPMQDFNYFSIRFYYIISTTYQKIGDLVCSLICLDFHTACLKKIHLTFLVILCLGIDVVSILLDIVVLAIWYPHNSKVLNNSSEQFSAVMAIFNLIFRYFFRIWQISLDSHLQGVPSIWTQLQQHFSNFCDEKSKKRLGLHTITTENLSLGHLDFC